MPDPSLESNRRVLDPIERISEVLFGLIMVLTFTGSLSVAEAGRDDVRAMLIGALGCNLAWGLIDGIMYLMGCMSDQAQRLQMLRSIRQATRPEEAHRRILQALPPSVVPALQPAELDRIRDHLNRLPEPPERPHLHRHDCRGAFGVFLLVFLSTLPVVVPFVFMHNAREALRVSNLIAVLMLFATGYAFGRCVGHRPVVTGIVMVVLGSVLVAITMALGG